jgi:hypothetical protein
MWIETIDAGGSMWGFGARCRCGFRTVSVEDSDGTDITAELVVRSQRSTWPKWQREYWVGSRGPSGRRARRRAAGGQALVEAALAETVLAQIEAEEQR